MEEKKAKDKIRVGVLRGGAGKHYASSLLKGGEIISYIFENLGDTYKPVDILIDKEGIWHLGGVPVEPAKLLYKVDVVWNTSHPSFSNILQSFSIPNVGIPPFYKFFGENKETLQKHLKKIGLPIPRYIISPKNAKEVFEKFSAPWIVKSFTEDSNLEISLVKTFPELVNTIYEGVKYGKSILVEEFIGGKVASLHSVPLFRGQDIYVFPLGNTFGNFSLKEKEKLANLTKILHNHLGAKHYLKSDFVLNKRGKVYLLGIDVNPDLKMDSHFSEVCEYVGTKTHHVVKHILDSAL